MRNIVNWKSIVFLFILAAAIFLRTYHFNDWLYFKMDQARDAFLIGNAVENGPSHLPLLGPRAGATEVEKGYLRLGPAYYYFQYLSGALFHSTRPYIFAYPDLFFSIIVIPLLYVFLRLYFSSWISLLSASMYALSFIIIQYSRFAWNPNTLPFFAILSFFGLLKFLNSSDGKRRMIWIGLWALGLSIGSQLHFFGFFALAGISALVLFFHYQAWNVKTFFQTIAWKKIFRYSAIVMAVFLFIYSPVIISDVMKKGENAKNFVSALANKPSDKPLMEKIPENASEQLKYYCLIVTSSCYGGTLKSNFIPALSTAIILLSGIALAALAWKKTLPGVRKDFLALVIVWVGVFFILSIPVAFQLRPRFFIVVFAVPFIFLGFIFEYLEKIYPLHAKKIAAGVTLLVIFSNVQGTRAWFREQELSQRKSVIPKRTLILKRKDGITLGQLEGAVKYMYDLRKPDYTLYFYSKSEYVMPIKYLLFSQNDPTLEYSPLKLNGDPKAQYFSIDSVRNEDEALREKYGENFKILSSRQFGQLVVHELEFSNRDVKNDFTFNKERRKSDRIFWGDVFGLKEDGGIEIEGAE